MTDEQWRAHAAEEALRSAEALVRQALALRPEIARGALSPNMTGLVAAVWPAMQHHLTTLLESDWKDGTFFRNFVEARVAVEVAERMQKLGEAAPPGTTLN